VGQRGISMTSRKILSALKAILRAAASMAVCLAMPIAAFAQQSPITASSPSVKVSLVGLDLTTPRGLAEARNRLYETAHQGCTRAAGNQEPSDPANFVSCMDNTLMSEMKQINSGNRIAIAARGSAWPTASDEGTISLTREIRDTRVMIVSIADLDILSPQDALIAQERIHNTARRICGQLTSSQDPASIYAKCVNDATAGALRQISENALATN
jgi:UrcA family protein